MRLSRQSTPNRQLNPGRETGSLSPTIPELPAGGPERVKVGSNESVGNSDDRASAMSDSACR